MAGPTTSSSSQLTAGQRAEPRAVLVEVMALYLVTLLAIRLVVDGVSALGLHEIVLAAVPILFMYAPVWLCRWRGVDSWGYPLHLPALRDRDTWVEALRLNGALIALVVVPFLVGYHLWQTTGVPMVEDLLGLRLYPTRPALGWTWPSSMLKLVGYHLFFVAIPEEIFYRGYIQTRLDEAFPPRWRILGATVGPGLLLTCVIFALGHSLVILQWWHVFIVVPSLAFGWMRARTGGIIAGALFHAWCNVTVSTLDTLYGIVPP